MFSNNFVRVKVDYNTCIKISLNTFDPDIEYEYMFDGSQNHMETHQLLIYFRTDIDKNLFSIKHPEIVINT